MRQVNAIVVAAMEEETAPFTEIFNDFTFSTCDVPAGTAKLATRGHTTVLFLTTGVGMVAASTLLSWVLSKFKPRLILSVGSAGGLDSKLSIGDVIIGTNYVHGTADATAFGYKIGQIPGQPESFAVHHSLVEPIQTLQAAHKDVMHVGTVASSDTFVTENNVADLREAFPGVLSADMESHALAQVCHTFKVPFASIRSISDVVGAERSAEQAKTFNSKLDDAAFAAARATKELLLNAQALSVRRSGHGPAQHFSRESLQAALYFMLAQSHSLEPSSYQLPSDIEREVNRHLEGLTTSERRRILGLVSAGFELAQTNTSASLTAKDFDTHRTNFIERYPEADRSGFAWPPTSQTVIKRFNGYWNDALGAIGLTPRRGRNRGGLKFTPDDYLFAVRSYVVDSRRAHRQPSFNNYSLWLERTDNTGKLPSGAAIRQRFGSWREALAAAALRTDA